MVFRRARTVRGRRLGRWTPRMPQQTQARRSGTHHPRRRWFHRLGRIAYVATPTNVLPRGCCADSRKASELAMAAGAESELAQAATCNPRGNTRGSGRISQRRNYGGQSGGPGTGRSDALGAPESLWYDSQFRPAGSVAANRRPIVPARQRRQ